MDFDPSQFHFLRAEWLLALPLVFLLGTLLLRRKLFSRGWQSVIDSRLLPHVLVGKTGKHSRLPAMLFIATGTLVVLALAGPAWEKLPQPVFKQQSALIIALDLSRSMDATDITPSRLTRARYKIADILKLRRDGQTALIAYAAGAFTVTPLTDDTDTINALLPSLDTGIMPSQGSRPDRALQKAQQLFANAGVTDGDVLLVTDGVNDAYLSAFEDMTDAGHRISILASGSPDGAPIPLDTGGFLKDAQGAIVIPELDTNQLRSAALSTGGRFSRLTADDRDIQHLLGLLDTNRFATPSKQTELRADVWREQGPWLLLLVIPLAALVFRRGYLVLLVTLIVPWSPRADAMSWDSLWRNSNQRAAEKFHQEHHEQAARLFTDPRWQAAAHYRAGDYEHAVQALQELDTADAHYNRGNALARLGRLQEAIDAYDQALEKKPDHEDAAHNKQLLEQQQKQKQQQQPSQDHKQQDSNRDSSGDDSGKPQQQPDAQSRSTSESPSKQDTAGQQGRPESDENAEQASRQQAQQGSEQQEGSSRQTPKQQPVQQRPGQQQSPSDQQQQLSRQASEQWLRRIPDDPGGLLRRKFKYQYQRQQQGSSESQPW